jgi:hypothetical protein
MKIYLDRGKPVCSELNLSVDLNKFPLLRFYD